MKKLIVLLALLPLLSYSQAEFPIDEKTNKISFSEVIYLDSSLSKTELYLRAKNWFVNAFASANHVIQMDDKEEGIIIGKGMISVYTTLIVNANGGKTHFRISVFTKDGRYKYELTDLYHDKGTSNIAHTPGNLQSKKAGGGFLSMGKQNWNGIKRQSYVGCVSLIESLKEHMSSKVISEEEW